MRVREMLECLKEEDIEGYLINVEASRNSSFRFLQNIYSPSHPTEQGLSLGIALAEQILEGDGAVRVHGGGFAGTIQAYVPEGLLDIFTDKMDALFGKGATTVLSIRKKPTCRLI